MSRVSRHLLIWLAVFVFWVMLSRSHHPTLTINALATGILVSVSAACFYIHDIVLRPRLLIAGPAGHRFVYAGCLILAIAVLDLGAVLLIQGMYDRLWGPDPARFWFWTNVLYEAIFIVIHLMAAVFAVHVLRQKRRET